MFDIITIGSATRDIFLKTRDFETREHAHSPTGLEQCLALGSKMEVHDLVVTTGGGGTNSAVTFARQGFKVSCLGVVGQDRAGEEICEELKGEGINLDYFQVHDDNQSALSVILVNASGERTILSYKGEGQHLSSKKVPWNKLKTTWLYLDSLGGHFDLLEDIFKYAQAQEVKVAFNPGGQELAHGLEKIAPFLSQVDIFITNREEGAQLTGLKQDDFKEILDNLSARVRGLTIISDGPQGVRVREGRQKEYLAGIPDSPIVERTGAGDAFGSGFVAEYLRTGDVIRAIQYATANASSVVTRFGAKAGILKKDETGPWPLVSVKTVVL